MKPLWDFHCTAIKLDNGRFHVRIETKSGIVIERTGYNPIWELIRIVGRRKTSPLPHATPSPDRVQVVSVENQQRENHDK